MRLDLYLVERFGISSRQKAQALIMRGDVFLGTQALTKSGYQLKESDLPLIQLRQKDPYVGFGAYKLLKALEVFSLEKIFENRIILDVGSSTGGFTQVLLEKGAKCVYSVDVGENQLDYRLRMDERVVSHEKTDVRNLEASYFFRGYPEFFVVDVSFISLQHIFPVLARLGIPEGIALIKPQFEVGKEISKFRGIVRDSGDFLRAIEKVESYAHKSGFKIQETTPSPIQKLGKNQEFLALVKRV